MTERERFLAIMSFEKPDRVPYFEEGIRDDVLKVWHKQGFPPGKKIGDLFLTDQFEEIAPELEPIPDFDTWPASLNELNILKNRLNPYNPKRLPKNWEHDYRLINQNNQVLFYRVHRGLFLSLGVYKWQRFLNVVSLLLEDPEYVHHVLAIQAEFSAKMLEITLKSVNIDAVIFSEPIGGNEGPLISPMMYEKFVLESFRPIFQVLQKNKIEILIIRTYANARILIPSFLKYGMNCLWACETNIDTMDYLDLRSEYGKELRLIGGIDLDVLRKGKEAIRREIETKVPPLIEEGGYIPLADGRIRQDISFDNYCYYRQLLQKVTKL
jgi:Uroporphyrinogen decarboxylase (URO-D)